MTVMENQQKKSPLLHKSCAPTMENRQEKSLLLHKPSTSAISNQKTKPQLLYNSCVNGTGENGTTSTVFLNSDDDQYKEKDIGNKVVQNGTDNLIGSGRLRRENDQDNDDTKYGAFHTYKKRWYILFIFSVYSVLNMYLTNVWVVTADSTTVVFDWAYEKLSLMQIWFPAMYFVAFLPSTWLLTVKGMRISIIISIAIMILGSVLRCISLKPPYITWLANISNGLIGISSVTPTIVPPVLSSTWFPINQRATATSIGIVVEGLGISLCFLIGPSVVSEPIENIHYNHTNASSEYTNIDEITYEMRILRICEAVVCMILLVTVLLYYPEKPNKPPSASASAALPKYDLKEGLKSFFKSSSANFWLVSFSYCISVPVYGHWFSLLQVVFKNTHVSQVTVGYLGSVTGFICGIAVYIFGRIGDRFLGKLKIILCISMSAAAFLYVWTLLMVLGYLPINMAGVFITIILQNMFIVGPAGLFVEMAVELNYPIPESVTGSMVALSTNIFPMLYLVVFFVPGTGISWMTWTMFVCLIVCLPPLFCFKETYQRLELDRKGSLVVEGKKSETLVKSVH